MPRRRFPLAIAATCFVLVLLYATLKSADGPPGVSPEDRKAASGECQDAVHEDLPDARFPFSPNVTASDDGGVRLSGSVDSGSGITAARHNYECFLSERSTAGAYRVDSVNIWRSH